MPNYGFDAGLGPHSLKYVPTTTAMTPSDTDAATKVIAADMPLKWKGAAKGRGDTVALCADGDVPQLVAIERCELPTYPIGVIMLPGAAANSTPAQSFVLDIPYSGAVPAAAEVQVLADGAGKFKFVTTGGIGRLLKDLGNGRALVEF